MARSKANRTFVWVVLILLFVGLMGFGTGGLSGRIDRLGYAGDTPIALNDYSTTLQNQIRAFEAQTGERVTFQQAQELGLDQLVLRRVVTDAVLDNEASSLGLSVGDARVRDEVLNIPAFRNLSGEFDRESYRAGLDRMGQTEAEFEASLRAEIARTLLQGAVIGGIPAPQGYAETLVDYLGETRDVTYAQVTADDLEGPIPGPTDEAIQTYYDENPDEFLTPETRNITYAWLTPEMIQDEVEVSEDELRALYDERIDQFQQPERRLVERLVFPDSDAAASALARIDAGETDFDGLVAERGLELDDVDLGDVAIGDLGAAGEPVFQAAAGDVIGPLDTDLGPALFRVNAVLAEENVTFEDARDDLAAELGNLAARRVIDQARDGMTDLIAGGATLEDLAERTQMELGTMDYTAASEDGPAAYDGFRAAAEAAQEGAFPEIMELADGGIFALRLDGVTAPETPPLAEVRDDVAAAWTARRTQELVMERAEDLAGDIAPLTGFDTLGLEPQTAENLLRRSFVEGVGPDFIDTVFGLTPGEVAVVAGEAGAQIVRLDAVSEPDPEDDGVAAQLDTIGQNAAQGIAQDIYDAYADAVQSRTEVRIDQSALNALNAQFQ